MTEEIETHVLRKYEILQKLGRGAYGTVWKAIDKKTRKVAALKKVFDAFQNSTDAQRIFIEIMLLQELNDHENIIRLLNMIRAKDDRDLYLVFDFMETDLHAVIRANILEDIHKKYISYQIVKALKYMHTGKLLHYDLKPSNVLLNSECLVKICDFQSVISVASQEDALNSECYPAARWYRAPEVLLKSTKYTTAIDMWSLGCILGEMICGRPIFPGTSTLNQLHLMFELIGRPSDEDIKEIQSDLAPRILHDLSPSKNRSWRDYFPTASDDALDMIIKLLQFNPSKRLTVKEALRHPYFAEFYNPDDEPACNRTILINNNYNFTITEYKEKIFSIISDMENNSEETI